MSTWEENVRKVVPYTPGEQPKERKYVKLNTNENPYPPSPKVSAAALSFDALRLYPDPAASDLVHAIAEYHGVSDRRVFVGVGSDDVLAMAFMTFFHSGKKILFPDITYSFYDVWADMLEIPFETIPLTGDYRIDPADYARECGGIVFPNPNAPTGIALPIEDVRSIISKNPNVVVIVDEAYIDFGGTSALTLLDEFENLLVVRTFSKSRSMAGLRIGYAIGSEKMIAYLNDVKYSYNSYTMNRPSIIYGVESIRDDAYFKETVEKVIKTREAFAEAIRKAGYTVLPSSANFVFASHPTIPAKEIFARSREAGFLVRYFDKPRIDNFLRISIGTDEEMRAYADFLCEI